MPSMDEFKYKICCQQIKKAFGPHVFYMVEEGFITGYTENKDGYTIDIGIEGITVEISIKQTVTKTEESK